MRKHSIRFHRILFSFCLLVIMPLGLHAQKKNDRIHMDFKYKLGITGGGKVGTGYRQFRYGFTFESKMKNNQSLFWNTNFLDARYGIAHFGSVYSRLNFLTGGIGYRYDYKFIFVKTSFQLGIFLREYQNPLFTVQDYPTYHVYIRGLCTSPSLGSGVTLNRFELGANLNFFFGFGEAKSLILDDGKIKNKYGIGLERGFIFSFFVHLKL